MHRGSKKLFNMTRVALFALGLVCFSNIGYALAAEHRANPSLNGKPNILVIMVDDFGFDDLAINNGNTQIATPNMDQLAHDGVRFTRHYASAVALRHGRRSSRVCIRSACRIFAQRQGHRQN